MEIRADEITRILREQLGGFTADIDVAEVGTVLSVGDGIARIHGLEQLHGRGAARVPPRGHGHGPQPRGGQRGRGAARRVAQRSRRATRSSAPGASSVPVGDALVGRVVNALGQPIDGKGPIATTAFNPIETIAPGVVERQPVQGAAADRPQGHRRHDPHRPRPARADHRRPPDRQDRRRRGHDHQPEGQGRHLHLRGHRPEAVHGGAGGARRLEEYGAMEYTIVVAATASDPAPMQYIAPYAGCAMGEYFRDNGKHALVDLRRPLQAGRGLPPDLAAAAPPAGPRGLPRRRLLPAQPPAGARGQAERRAGRRHPHRAAHHRDAGRRHLRLHPDQRHLDHRRPDLPGERTCSTPASARP